MNEKQFIKYLKYLFDGSTYAEMFEVVDDSIGLRKAGLRLSKVKEYPDGDEDYKVTINKIALDRWLGEKK